jgi:hypothetical protein
VQSASASAERKVHSLPTLLKILKTHPRKGTYKILSSEEHFVSNVGFTETNN